MKKFIIITGPSGVGKTTVGKKLCDKLTRAAFIDGDWCLDIHPFVGNKETKNMAIDNITHMIKNYNDCNECDTIVLSWVMSNNTINKILTNLSEIAMQIFCFTLICNEDTLKKRWAGDNLTEWRNSHELEDSIKSLDDYATRSNVIHTDNASVDEIIFTIIDKITA